MRPSTLIITDEERLVAELGLLGIHYLSRQSNYCAEAPRPPADLFVDLIRQPSARVRGAVIALLLAHPEYGDSIKESLEHCSAQEQISLCYYYTAVMLLQQIHAEKIRLRLGHWRSLPDLFSKKLSLPNEGTPHERLMYLGKSRQQQTGAFLNWAGTYQDVARRLLRQWELEKVWQQYHPIKANIQTLRVDSFRFA